MSVGLVINFKDGEKRTENQLHRLGIVVPDGAGDLWTYVQFAENVGYGDVVRDSVSTDLIGNSGVGTVSVPGAVSPGDTHGLGAGEDRLIDTGEFAADDDKWLVGALGWIHEGPGQGTAFYVRRVIDNNTLEVEILSTGAGRGGSGWPVELTTATKYSLYMPGLVRRGVSTGITRGVAQAAATKGQYGFVKQTRGGVVNVDAGGTALGIGVSIVPVDTPGQVAGAPNSGLGATRVIGQWKFLDLSGASDSRGWADLTIENEAISHRYPDEEVALNRVEVS